VSVVVVSRNRAAQLRRCLESLEKCELRYTLPGQKIDGTQE
jgi:glycosyltransferase involved in cell wall biosynthesis